MQSILIQGALRALFCACLLGLTACAQRAERAPIPGGRVPAGSGASRTVLAAPSAPGWGIDACLTAHVEAAQQSEFLPLLRSADIRVLRERGPGPRLRELKDAGNFVVSFVGLGEIPREQVGNALPEDLLAAYHAAVVMARKFQGVVDAWEMVGEPDVGYCTDLPDRVTAFQKAVYLGIKAGLSSGQAPLVLMGALALPPGPWLQRAVKNGLLDYTDAYNFHFYGHAEDLPGVIAAHRRFGLPLWITECGINAVAQDDFLNPERRILQAEFTAATARQAWITPEVAVFMPFILVGKDIPHALTLSPRELLPAWHAYADFTRRHPWPQRPIARPEAAANPVVLQWLPDNATTEAHKVSGSYRFRPRGPIRGELRVYNFSPSAVRGRLVVAAPRRVKQIIANPAVLEVAPLSVAKVPIAFSREDGTGFAAPGYFCEELSAVFVDEQGRASPVAFTLESPIEPRSFQGHILALSSPGKRPRFTMYDEDRVTARSSRWLGLNGVSVQDVPKATSEARGIASAEMATRLRVAVDETSSDPLQATYVSARVRGLPPDGFIRLQLDRPMDRDFQVRVDLIDRLGQRFTIWENFGVSYFHPKTTDVWLRLRDFHVYFWGRCTANPVLRPAEVEEIQLRLYISKTNDPREVGLSFQVPKE